MISEIEVRAALNAIVDPCSAAAGEPAGLDDMGLVRRVTVRQDGTGRSHVDVVIAVTEFGCLMGAPFAQSAYDRLLALDGIGSVDVRLDDRFDWAVEDMSPSYRARLEAKRSQQRRVAAPMTLRRV